MEVYAQYGLITVFTTFVSALLCVGQDESFMRYFECRTDSYWHFLWKCLRIPAILSIIMSLILLEPRHTVLQWVFGPNLSFATVLLLLLFIVSSIAQRFFMLTARMEERAANYAISQIVSKLLFIGAIFGYMIIDCPIELKELIIALQIGIFFAIVINLLVITGRIHNIKYNTRQSVSSKELLVFGCPFTISSTLFFVIPMVERIIIRDMTSCTTLAIYTTATVFITVMVGVKTTISGIWIPYVYKKYENKNIFQNVCHNWCIALSCLCLFILSFVICFRRWLVLIFDSNYYECYLIAPALVSGACFDVLATIYSVGINIARKTAFHILIPLIQLIISLILLYVLLPTIGLRATGIAYLSSITISRLVQMGIAAHYYNIDRNYSKVSVIMGLYIVFGLLACFNDSLLIDAAYSIALLAMGFFIAKKEMTIVVESLLGDKVRWRKIKSMGGEK